MSSPKYKLRLIGAFAALAALALAISCRGFFQNPTVSTITIDPPSPSVDTGATQQMTAAATYSDGSTGTLTGGTSCTGNTVCWSSSDTSVATITTGGLMTGVTEGSATITAASGAITGTTTATVTLGNVTGLTIYTDYPTTVANPVDIEESGTQDFYAYATLSSGSPIDVSATATWTSNNTTYVTVTNGEDPMVAQATATPGSTTITASYISNGTTYTATVNVAVVAP
jgi:trimeric autotransporter adhesin